MIFSKTAKSAVNDAVAHLNPSWTGTIVLTAIMAFPRSFAGPKMVLISIFIASQLVGSFGRDRLKAAINVAPIATFYLIVSLLGIIWSMVGLHNGGNSEAFPQYLRLYVLWSGAFFLLIVALRQTNAMLMFHRAVVLAGILIAVVNAIGIIDYNTGSAIIPQAIKDQLELRVGFHDGYTQITSHNIGFLLFVCGYLIAWHCRTFRQDDNRVLTHISLIMSLGIVIASGRRAIWLVMTLTPLIIIVVAALTNSNYRTKNLKNILVIGAAIGVFLPIFFPLDDTIRFVQSAFSPDDERTIQSSFLIDGFFDFPLFGSGFGANAGYTRSDTAPWLYELTYHQMLFNFGILGCGLIALTALVYFRLAFRAISSPFMKEPGAFELVAGLVTFLIGSYSNPYLGSFDFSLTLAVLPLLASYVLHDPAMAQRPALPTSRRDRRYQQHEGSNP